MWRYHAAVKLFLNLTVAQALLSLDVGVMNTTRKNSKDFPEVLLQIKNLNQALLYGDSLAIIKEGVLCFAWQDNNVILSITTAFLLHTEKDFVLRDRRRPRIITLPGRGADGIRGLPTKMLSLGSSGRSIINDNIYNIV